MNSSIFSACNGSFRAKITTTGEPETKKNEESVSGARSGRASL